MCIWTYAYDMSKRYSVSAARAHLSDILDEVEGGKEVELTRRGRPVAVILSSESYDALRREQTNFADAYRAFTARHAPAEIALESHFYDSFRDRAPGRKIRLPSGA